LQLSTQRSSKIRFDRKQNDETCKRNLTEKKYLVLGKPDPDSVRDRITDNRTGRIAAKKVTKK
jgi:hypothetical protein